jgi:glycosyltransferase involved in cell wall biosynthesis
VFILPTLTEALPTVLAEAMASRLPIIASAVGGVPEMIADDENGKLVIPTNPAELSKACISLIGNPDKRDTMGDFGWQVVNQKFDIKKQVVKLENLYLEQINRYEK